MPESQTPKTNYPGNKKLEPKDAPWKEDTTKAAGTPPKAERITKGEAVERKKPLGKRLRETFIGDDAGSVGQYLLFEVLVPAAKTTVTDLVTQGVERMIYGDSRPVGRSRFGQGSYTSYNRMHQPGPLVRKDEPRRLSRQARATHDFRDILLESRAEAEEVLTRLDERIRQYEVATVQDLYDMVGITGSFTDERYGWDDIRGARVQNVRGGFLVDLPSPIPIR